MIAALFVRSNSVYHQIPGIDCYDHRRDALTFKGTCPVIAHPPCRGWGRLRHFSKHSEAERDLARFALKTVRANGGILEHPESSLLWPETGLLRPGYIDRYGGFTLVVDQSSFGHRARKRSWLYFCGVEPLAIPPPKTATHLVANMCAAERERTPLQFALWLIASLSLSPSPHPWRRRKPQALDDGVP